MTSTPFLEGSTSTVLFEQYEAKVRLCFSSHKAEKIKIRRAGSQQAFVLLGVAWAIKLSLLSFWKILSLNHSPATTDC